MNRAVSDNPRETAIPETGKRRERQAEDQVTRVLISNGISEKEMQQGL
jgi:hypothetical protein